MIEKNSSKAVKIFCIICIAGISLFLSVTKIAASYAKRQAQPVDSYFVIQLIIYFLILSLLAAGCMYAFFDKNYKIKPEKAYLIAGIVMGFVYLLLIPITAVPDEHTHINSAYNISNTLMGTEGNSDTLMMRAEDAAHYYNSTNLVRDDYNYEFRDAFHKAVNRTMVDTGITVMKGNTQLYILPAIGITIGRLLGLSTTLVFLLGRIFNMAAFIAATYYAVKRMPFGKGVVTLWALLPITLQQTSSFSYDAPVFALSILIISTTLSMAYGGETGKKRRITDLSVMIISCILLLPCKGFALFPIVAFPLMLIPKYFKNNPEKAAVFKEKIRPWMKGVATGILVVFVCLAGFVIMKTIKRWLLPENINNNYIEWANHTGFTPGYFIKNPVRFFEIILNTIWIKSDVYFSQMFGGLLGWLDINIPFVFTLGFVLILVYVAMRKENEEQLIKNGERIWMIIVFIGIICTAVAGMLFNWTPNNADCIEGVQGRYFLPALVLGLIALRTKKTGVSVNSDRYGMMWTVFLHVIVVTTVFRNIP